VKGALRPVLCLIVFLAALGGCTPPAARPPVVALTQPTRAELPRQGRPCAARDVQVSLGSLSERSSASVVGDLGTGIDSYRLQDGAWLSHAPVLVNEEFDFGTAMGLGPIGAGLAAKQRADHNVARSRELESIVLSERARRLLDGLRACGIHRWALLWNGKDPGLHVITDFYDRDGKRPRTTEQHLPQAALTSEQLWLSDPGSDDTAPFTR
jgi:hypothetical protein